MQSLDPSVFVYPIEYEVIVVGGGHAGVEAGLAAAKMGCRTLLVSFNLDTIGQMSCNPAIGGLAKGQLAREVDAMGGAMGKITDLSGLQFRMLNTKKGPAVWAPRAQCDKRAYQLTSKWMCESETNLDLAQCQVARLLHRDGLAYGIETTLNVRYMGAAIVLTTGTFLRGVMHIGFSRQSGGRLGESSAMFLSHSLTELGLELGRLKTGTPPRVLKRSIDFEKTEVQLGDEPVPYFTYWKDDLFHVEQPYTRRCRVAEADSSYPIGSILERIAGQLPCHITYTTSKTAEIIRSNLSKSPLYSGVIKGIGPRYCPSIEDKVVRFPEKDHHQIFLEPEGISTDEVYVNGLSTSLPFEVQIELIKTIIGCEHAEIIRPAYAVEYDFAFPTQLHQSLEVKGCRNLYLAGQINGTSGYEEAAAQGLMAGINAARRVRGLEPVVLRRDQAYIGVLIDDLVTKGTSEPYRMFSSRAEYRLMLRQDNADLRLSKLGCETGLLPQENYLKFEAKRQAIEMELVRLNECRVGRETLAQVLRQPGITYRDLPHRNLKLTPEEARQVEIAIKYEGYIDRQEAEVAKFRSYENKQIPPSFDYSSLRSLRTEAREKLMKLRPATLGQAARISGVSPSDISILVVWLKRVGGENGPSEKALSPWDPEVDPT